MTTSLFIFRCLFLVPIFIIGCITSYTDIKYGKIKNSHLFWLSLYLLFLYSFLIFYSYFFIYQSNNLKYLLGLLINGSIALIIGYVLWYFNLWAAGDAKLFLIYSLLIPLEFYSKSYVPYFPALTLLINTFFLICFFFLFKMGFQIIRSGLKNLQKIIVSFGKHAFSFLIKSHFSKINYKNIQIIVLKFGQYLLLFFCFTLLLQIIKIRADKIFQTAFWNSSTPFFFLIIQLLAIRALLKNKVFSSLIILSGLLCCIVLITSNQTFVFKNALKMSIFLTLFIIIGIHLIYWYIENYEIKKISFQDLKLGNFLALKSSLDLKNRFPDYFQSADLSFVSSDGLSESQIQTVKELLKDDSKKELYIYKTIPFAPFMFLACLLIIFFRTSLVALILSRPSP